MTVTVKEGQCLADVAIAVCGSVEGVWALALRNGISVTTPLECGQTLEWEPEDVIDTRVVAIYAADCVATAGASSDICVASLIGHVDNDRANVDMEIVDIDPEPPQSTRASVFVHTFSNVFT